MNSAIVITVDKAKKILIVICGPTAVGKTSVAIDLAKELQTDIYSADSRQLYRELTIGTAKPSEEELDEVKHHFINAISIEDPYSAGRFELECIESLDFIFQEKDVAILVGGTGLYIDAVLVGLDQFPDISKETKEYINNIYLKEGLLGLQKLLKQKDPSYYEFVDLENSRRLTRALEVIVESDKPYSNFLNQEKPKRSFNPILIHLNMERELLYERINIRVDQMMTQGLLDEVENLKPKRHLKALQTVGYSELFKYLDGEYTLNFAISEIKKNTRRYAKRQNTWFKKYKCNPFSSKDLESILAYIDNQMDKCNNPK